MLFAPKSVFGRTKRCIVSLPLCLLICGVYMYITRTGHESDLQLQYVGIQSLEEPSISRNENRHSNSSSKTDTGGSRVPGPDISSQDKREQSDVDLPDYEEPQQNHVDPISSKKQMQRKVSSSSSETKPRNSTSPGQGDDRCRGASCTYSDLPDGQWYPVINGSRNHFVFSAFLDPRQLNKTVIRIIGVSVIRANINFYCQLWDTHQKLLQTSKGSRVTVRETHGLRYAATFYLCPVSQLPKTENLKVSLSLSKSGRPTHYLPLMVPDANPQPLQQFTVCISPIHYTVDDVYSFVESMEVNRILGAEKIVLYNHTTGPQLSRYISHYVDLGLVDVIPWKIPLRSYTNKAHSELEKEIHYFGQVAALNDCLYRYMFRTKYIVFTDLDELIVPKGNVTTWAGMMLKLTKDKERGAFLFRNTFFNLRWPDDTESGHKQDRALHLRTTLKFWRLEKTFPHRVRSKMIVIAKDVTQTGIHFVFHYSPGARQHNVNESVGLLHHYRVWMGKWTSDSAVRDTTMMKYTTQIRQRVEGVHKTLRIVMKD